MKPGLYENMSETLKALQQSGGMRVMPEADFSGNTATVAGQMMLNLSSNDYLGLSADSDLQRQFLNEISASDEFLMSSCSSRLLTGNFAAYGLLEQQLAQMFNKQAALVFSSGYHANIGILSAVSDSKTLVLADKLVHASIIDGLHLSKATVMRFAHNNIEHLNLLLNKYAPDFNNIIIATESVFSMDGDVADLPGLVELKKSRDNVYLYVDEAHAFGVRGENGLGVAEEKGLLQDIDFLVATFGKAIASQGAFVVCSQTVRDYLVNKMRSLIYTTALPPINVKWTSFVLDRLKSFSTKRNNLHKVSDYVRKAVEQKGYGYCGESHIVPVVVGGNESTIALAKKMQSAGFYVLPLRPPTVPPETSRLRLSLTAAISMEQAEELVACLPPKSQLE